MNEFKLKILFLDDNPVELSLMKYVLQKDLPEIEFHGITVAPNWKEFFVDTDFDAIVIDYRLTGRNGLEEIGEIRKHQSTIPLFLITALERDEITRDAMQFGATDLITKDRNFSFLTSKLRDLLIQKSTEDYSKLSTEEGKIFEEYSSCVYLKINLEGKVIDVVGNSLKILGCRKEELLDDKWQTFLPIYKVKISKLKSLIQQKIFSEDGSNLQSSEVELKGWDGNKIWLRYFEKVIDQNLLLILQNISSLKILENQLADSQKLNTIGALAAGIAHDFNNILAAIRGYASLGLKRLENRELMEKYLTNILKASESGADLTSQILAFSKRVTSKEKVLDFNLKINEAVSILQKVINPKIEIIFELEENLPKIFIDPGHAVQIVLNLCLNAADAMPKGGKIFLSTLSVSYEKDKSSSEGKFIRFSVRDTGTGIKLSEKNKIFDPFFTSKGIAKGTGLGLAVVKNIVDNYSGKIDFESEEDVGTTFNIYLPVSDRSENEETVEETFSRGGNEGLLIVDDEKSIRDFSSEYLSDLGYKIFTAEDGEVAIKTFDSKPDDIHLIILDLTLPKISGIEVLEYVKRKNPNVKVILTSGYMIEKDSGQVEDSKIDDFIQKPYTVEKLAQVVRKNLDSI
ncbi:MAG: response regulator [Bacteroidetes bacterium]|nr:response regulator [Bacteroidota bacterium]